MDWVAIVVMGVLSLVMLIAAVRLLVVAFQTSVPWGLAVLLVPGAVVVFALLHWDVAKKPFLISMTPAVLGIAAAIVIPNLVEKPEAGVALPDDPTGKILELAQRAREELDPSAELAESWLRGGDASCPAESEPVGARPPQGRELWCERAGVRHGPYASWHANGKPASAGLFRDGRREGVWLRYSQKGDLEAEASFAGDLQHGTMRTYDAFGRLRSETRWVEGQPAG